MARLIARVRILPAEEDSDLQAVVESLRTNMPDGIVMKEYKKEPIAFGLNAIIGDFLIDDEQGQMDKLEQSIRDTRGVGEIEVVYISRQSVRIK